MPEEVNTAQAVEGLQSPNVPTNCFDQRSSDQIEQNFVYHPPKGDQAKRYEEIRNEALLLARTINCDVPASREKSLALTKLEEAVFWANAGIARNE